MKQSTKDLIESVLEKHDWRQGQARGHGGTAISQTDTCRVCGLKAYWFAERQNEVEGSYTFILDDEEISLRAASELDC